ncbi:MAG: multidrug ABC transporter ATP-binding protein [Rhodospirillaceae bacterium]|nr:MAG: multidrug ABC transporter ATP-binding protein [Rhodospirillaceae bacterium]
MNKTHKKSATSVESAAAPPRENATENAIEIRSLKKVYRGGVCALEDFDLTIPRGSFFGLLGPNGAGKSTLINILAGLAIKTAGTVNIWGYDIDGESRRTRAAIGVVPQELNIDPFLTPHQALEVQAGFYGVPRRARHTDEILRALHLEDKADAYARTLSGGMQRRLLIAKAMVHNPPILVLDEPTAGVDVELRQQLWNLLRELNAKGTTILLTTHYLEEAEQLCEQIAIVNHGRLVACDRTENLLRRMDKREMVVTVAEDLHAVPETLLRFRATLQPPRCLHFAFRTSKTSIGDILSAVREAGLTVADLTTRESDLQDLFLQLTRRTPDQKPSAETAAGTVAGA